jgi:hypothetical protein
MQGLILSLPSPGTYEVVVSSEGKSLGLLCIGEQRSFSVVNGDNFFTNVTLCLEDFNIPDSGGGNPEESGLSGFVIAAAVLCHITVILAIGVVYRVYRLRHHRAAHLQPEPIDNNGRVTDGLSALAASSTFARNRNTSFSAHRFGRNCGMVRDTQPEIPIETTVSGGIDQRFQECQNSALFQRFTQGHSLKFF